MNIGDVAARCGLPAKTIRYYEDIGLVTPQRAANGYRSFRDSDLHKLAFLGRARSLGFTLDDCRSLLALYEDRGRASAEVKAIARDHLARIDRKSFYRLVDLGRHSEVDGKRWFGIWSCGMFFPIIPSDELEG